MESEASVHKKIELELQNKIKDLQKQVCEIGKERMMRMQEEEGFNHKLRDLEQALKELEDEYTNKEAEL